MDYINVAPPMELAVDATWSGEMAPWTDDFEEFVRRQTPQHINIYGQVLLTASPRYERPIRRRLRPEESCVKSHQTFSMITMPAGELIERRTTPDLSSSCSPMSHVTSATSSFSTRWGSSDRVEEIFENDEENHWEEAELHHHQGGSGVRPKQEPLDEADMDNLYEVKDALMQTPKTQNSSIQGSIKRPRGRPRKNPKPEPEALAKINKPRSKTGCGTCKRRKKKCDEGRPFCNNCNKNGYNCEGYRPLQQYKTGKEKKEEEELLQRKTLEDLQRKAAEEEENIGLPVPLITLFLCVETEADRIFFKHYTARLSIIYTVEEEMESSFRTLVLPVAQNDKGLMHSILSLASKHIDYTSPYGRQILMEHPNLDVVQLEQRSEFHRQQAYAELGRRQANDSVSAIHLQMVCQILETLSEKNPTGSHRLHLEYSQKLPPTDDQELNKFLEAFYRFHIVAYQAVYLPQTNNSYQKFQENWNPLHTLLQRDAVPLLGVSDPLLIEMSNITNLRNKIRERFQKHIDPPVDYAALGEAADIDGRLREWKPVWAEKDHRDIAGEVYRLMMCVYLKRTIFPPDSRDWKINERMRDSVNECLKCISHVKPTDILQTVMLTPTFMVGCAAFEPEQRKKVRAAIANVKSYMQHRNADTAILVLEEVWRLMDLKDERSWDWQLIAHEMGIDFLAT